MPHSSHVTLTLDCGEHGMIDLARVGPETVEARAPRDVPPCLAHLIVSVDGRASREPVRLVDGFTTERATGTVVAER